MIPRGFSPSRSSAAPSLRRLRLLCLLGLLCVLGLLENADGALRGVKFFDFPDIDGVSDGTPHVLSFVHRSAPYYDDVRNAIRDAAQRSVDMEVAYIEMTTDHADAFKFFHLHSEDTRSLPLVLVVKWVNGMGEKPYDKYLFGSGNASAIQGEALQEFAKKALAGELPQWIRSQPVVEEPATHDVLRDGALEIVGSQFQEMVIEKRDRDILLMFFAPWCGFSKRMQPLFDDLARHTAHVETLDLLKIDGSENDVEHPISHELSGYPFLAFFPGGEAPRNGYALKIETDMSDSAGWLKEALEFLRSQATHPILEKPSAPKASEEDSGFGNLDESSFDL